MRDYAKVAPQFWTGRTGKALKAAGPEAVIVGMYLMTSPHANMIGVYHCPLAYISIDTGIPLEGAMKGLQSAIEAGFCTFEAETDFVFVHEFAKYQIGEELKATDLRVKGIANELAKVPKGVCWRGFRAHYAVPFNLPCPGVVEEKPEAPSKPLRSQKQEQEQKKEKCSTPRGVNVTEFPPGFETFWKSYPRRQGKGEAAKAFARIRPDDALLQTIVAAVTAQASSEQWRKDGGKFIPMPATWLNGQRWLDETTTSAADPELAKLFARGVQ